MTDVQSTPETPPCACAHSTRRNVLLGVGAVGATAVLAACGSSNGGNTSGSDYSDTPAPAGSTGAQASGAGPAASGGDAAGSGGTPIAKAADVKVGSGLITGDYVITQPAAGTYKAFSKVCPHAGCDVNKVDAGVISCPCHGSQFSIKDGSVTNGPATKGLTEKSVKVDGGNIVAG
jgi:Rieske Fe-S protein